MVRVTFMIVSSLACGAQAFLPSPQAFQSREVLQSQPLHMVTASSDSFPDDFPENLPSRRENSKRRDSSYFNSVQEEDRAQLSRYVTGDDLHRLRHEVLALRLELQEARLTGSQEHVRELERAIMKAQQVDAEFVYSVSLERMELAQQNGQFSEAEMFRKQAQEARKALPHFNLEGLWVGKYSEEHGYALINVTYDGDTMIAHKITGSSESNVPKGQASFEVDLSPRALPSLDPVELGDAAARQWGCKYLERFGGRGQVAAEGYQDSQWIDGQLILVNEYFSFAWLPISHQVFFGRPTPELILKLLKEDKKKESGDCNHLSFLEKCWEETEHIEDEHEVSEGPSFVSTNQQDYYIQDGCFE